MTPTKLNQIKEHIDELFEALYEWDKLNLELELSSVQQAIKELENSAMDNPSHPQIKVITQTITDAGKCLDCIKKRIEKDN